MQTGERGSGSLDSRGDWIVLRLPSFFLKLILLAVAVALALFIGERAVKELAATRLAQTSTTANLQKAIQFTPGNAEYYYFLGHELESSLEEPSREAALEKYKKATELNPYNGFYWIALARVYESMGRMEEAQKAIEQAARVDPNQPLVAWPVGNFELRAGNVEEALKQFRVVLVGARDDTTLMQAVFDLAWRGTRDNQLILKLAIPQESRVELAYLNFLLGQRNLDASLEAWSRLAQEGERFPLSSIFPLIDALIDAHRVEDAYEVWNRLLTVERMSIGRATDTSLVSNGGFEGDVLDGGFSWRYVPLEAVGLRLDTVTFHTGARSLCVIFSGKENVNYNHFYEFVPVRPNTLYRFRGWMRGEQITTDMGPHFLIVDYYTPNPPLVVGDFILGSTPWQETNVDFRTGPETHLLRISVARLPSHKFDDKIQGKLWVDDVSLQALEEAGQPAAKERSDRQHSLP